MNLFKRLLAVSIICFSNAACADVVYLECDIEKTHYKITLDETAQTAVITDNGLTGGASYKVQAQFTQSNVAFRYVIPGLNIPIQYTIDRTNLAFTERVIHRGASAKSGMCKIAVAIERKF